jgi:hypothetical protein
MLIEWLYRVPYWLVYSIATLLIFGAAELGCWLALRSPDRGHEYIRGHITTIQSAMLGLLALLIGFTFSIALSHYDLRRNLVLDEANAIGRVALRAQLLPEGQAEKATELLKRYIDTRFFFTSTGDARVVAMEQQSAEAHDLLMALWAEAVTATSQDPHSVPAELFTQSLNEVIDLDEKRRIANRNRVPRAAFILLFAVASVASGFTGYAAGLAGTRQMPANAIMAIAIGAVMLMISDMDRPQRGLIAIDEQALTDVRNSLPK